MSVQTSANAETIRDHSSVPPLSAAQMSGPDAENTVNAFRGTVSFPIHLVSLVARNGLHVDLSISYQSNIEWARRIWNLAAPSGLLGLGWSFGFDMIVRDEAQSATDGEDVYYLVAEGTPVRLYRRAVEADGLDYEVEHHPFWRLAYHRSEETWELLLPDGNTKTFGGSDFARQYSVRWGNWSGPSSVTNGQERVPTIWNLSRIGSPWGDGIDFNYTRFDDDAIPIGAGGDRYTRASYLSSITSDIGRSLRFEYGQKRNDEEIREYVAPHARPAWLDHGAYQDRYETRYLSSVSAWSDATAADDGTRLLAIDLDYSLKNLSDDPTNPGLYKRYLDGITYRDQRGRAEPGLRFAYYGDAATGGDDGPAHAGEEAARGALRSITYPEGKVVSYFYENASLPGSALTRRLTEDDTGEGVPRVWVLDDYTLIARYDDRQRQLTVSACSWNGAWIVETVSKEAVDGVLDLDTLQVAFAEECFAVGYRANPDSGPREFRVHAFHRKFGEYGRWTKAVLKPVPIDAADADVTLVAGRHFVVAMASGAREVSRVVWNAKARDWDDFSYVLDQADQLAATALGNHYVLARYERRTASASIALVRFETFARRWQEIDLDVVGEVVWQDKGARVFLTTGPSMAVATFATDVARDEIRYQVVRYRWDAAFRPHAPEPLDPKPLPKDTALPFLLTILEGSVVGNLALVARFNGESWAPKEIPLSRRAGETLRQAYGEDLVVLSTKGAIAAYQYDPLQDDWQAIDDLAPSGEGPYTPTVGGRFVTLEDRLYFLGPDGILHDRGALGPDVVQSKVANHAPSYIAYGDRQGHTHLIFVENGTFFGTPVTIDEQLFPDKGGTAGTILTGPDSFVTYRTDDFDDARELTLRKVQRGRVDGAVPHVRVAHVSIDDGFALRRMAYAYEGAATTGPHGLTTQYSEVRVVEGSSDPTTRPHGSRLHSFHNGQIRPADGSAYYSLLNGSPRRVSSYDAEGALVAETEIAWTVFHERQTESGATEPLYGAYVRTESKTEAIFAEVLSLDGSDAGVAVGAPVEVTRRTRFAYNLQNGAVQSKHSENTNGDGEQEEIVVETLYGFEVYPGMRADNLLTPSSQTTTWVNGAVTSRSAVIWSNAWKAADGRAVWAPRQTYHARRADAALSPAEWAGDRPPAPDAWLLASEVLRRDSRGNVTASRNADGLVESLAYDTSGWQPVAKAHNGLLTGARADTVYTGFESYEALDAWSLESGAAVATLLIEGDSHTGRRSPRLVKDQGALTTTVEAVVPAQDCLLCGWVKTEPGFADEQGEARCTITIRPARGSPTAVDVPFADTDGAWTYFSRVVGAGAVGGDAEGGKIDIGVANAKPTAGLLIDTIYFGPKLGAFSAHVYDPVTRETTATVAADANVVYHVPDRDGERMADLGPGAVLAEFSADSLWRRGASLAAAGSSLNSSLSAVACSGAVLERFADGQGWKRRWSGTSSSWTVGNCALHHAASPAEESVSYNDADAAGSRSVYMKVQPSEPSMTAPVGLRIGRSCEVAWSPADGWQFTVNQTRPSAEACFQDLAAEQLAEEWFLLVTEHAAHFFADGRLLFAQSLSGPLSGELALFARDAVAFRDLMILYDASAEMAFTDGAGKTRQVQSLGDGTVIASGRLYDELHRPDVTTKAMLLPRKTFAYAASLVATFDRISGVMTGDVADYYSGQDGRSNDEGYPYHRVVFEASPLGREVLRGLPGKAFAIVQEHADGKVIQRNPHVARQRYGTNDGESPVPLPRGKYSVSQQIDADGVSTLSVVDQRGATIATALTPVAGPGTRSVSRSRYDAAGRLIELLTPQQVAAGGAAGERQGNRAAHDFLGRLVERHTVDGGITKSIHDRAGRLRFAVSNPGSSSKPTDAVVYTKYDVLGRTVEGGIVEIAWGDGEALHRIAESDPDWPSAGTNVPHRWLKRFSYDRCNEESATPYRCAYGLGQVWRAETQAEDGTVVASEREHDVEGNLIRVVAAISGPHKRRSEVRYRHDGNGALVGLTYPDGFALTYRMNSLGQIVAVLDESAKTTLAEYGFDAEGRMARKRLMADGAVIESDIRYLSPGWPTEIRQMTRGGEVLVEEHLRYLQAETREGKTPGSHTGRIVQVSDRLGAWSGQPDCGYVFATDGMGRLVRATQGTSAEPDPQRLDYDANGNIMRFDRDGRAERYEYAPGTNRVVRLVDSGGALLGDFDYDDQGRITAMSDRGLKDIVYDDATGLVTRLTKDGRSTRFLYDADNIRMASIEDGSGTIRHNVIGPNGMAIMEEDGVGATRFIYGPEGVLATDDSGGRRSLFVLDYQGSTRAVVRDGSVIAGFNYQPFGSLLGTPFGDAADVDGIRRRFTGKRFDPAHGLYDFGGRFYDPELGRFLSGDNAGQFFSPFLYAGNAPQDFVDPDGNFVVSTFLAIIAIAAAVGGAANAALHARETKNVDDFFFYFGVGAAIGAATAVPGAGIAASSAEAAGGVAAAFASAYEASSKTMTGVVLGSAAVDAALTNGANNLYEGNRFDDGLITSVAMAVGTAAVFEAAAAGMSRLGRPRARNGGDSKSRWRKAGKSFPKQEVDAPKNAAKRTVLAGHGTLTDAGGAHVKVPEGTTLTFYGPPGSVLMNDAANAVERGDALKFPRRLRMKIKEEGSGAVTTRVDPVTYRAGERVPNYVLKPISSGWLSTSSRANFRTVSKPTRLSSLLKRNMGDVDWAACCTIRDGGPTPAKIDVFWS